MRGNRFIMKNRTLYPDTLSGSIQAADIREMTQASDMQHLQASDDQELMLGRFWHCQLSDGLAVHLVDSVESQRASSSVEIAPCISINLIYLADLSFSLGCDQHQIRYDTNDNHQMLQCAVLTVGHKELFTRHLNPGQRVKKINITFDRQWFNHRAINKTQQQAVETLFSGHGVLERWQASDTIKAFADELMTMEQPDSMSQRLRLESRLTLLAAELTEQLLQKRTATPASSDNVSVPVTMNADQLKSQIDEHTDEGLTLEEIAAQCHISVSTLQKRFKSAFNMTVNQYIRKRLLDKGRKALIHDGVTIGEAAYAAGYNHSSNFITAFSKEFGLAPSEYVKRHRG